MGECSPTISVVICAYTLERLNDIHDAVNSVLGQTLPPHQVIVSVDHNPELLERLKAEVPGGVTVAFNDGASGLSETRNVAIRHATGDIVAFMDDDAVAEKDWLQKLIKPFDDPAVVAVGGKIIPLWLDGCRPVWFPEELDWIVGCTYKGLPCHGNQVRNLIGCNMAFQARVFQSIGLFRSEVGRTGKTQGAGEDSEFCLRLTGNLPGALILYEPEAVIYHKVPSWRVGLKYLVQRTHNEGYCKSMVRELCSGSSPKPLSTESSYLGYLLLTAIPQRVKHLYRPQALLQAGAILVCIAATGAGYLMGRLQHRRLAPPAAVVAGEP